MILFMFGYPLIIELISKDDVYDYDYDCNYCDDDNCTNGECK